MFRTLPGGLVWELSSYTWKGPHLMKTLLLLSKLRLIEFPSVNPTNVYCIVYCQTVHFWVWSLWQLNDLLLGIWEATQKISLAIFIHFGHAKWFHQTHLIITWCLGFSGISVIMSVVFKWSSCTDFAAEIFLIAAPTFTWQPGKEKNGQCLSPSTSNVKEPRVFAF